MKLQRILATLIIVMVVSLVGCSRAPSQQTEKTGTSSTKVIELDDSNFDAQIQSGVILVDFWATWCGPCRTQGPIVEELAAEVEGKAKVAKLDVDKAPRTAQRFKVHSFPTLIIFKDGEPVQQFVGVTKAKALKAAIISAADAK